MSGDFACAEEQMKEFDFAGEEVVSRKPVMGKRGYVHHPRGRGKAEEEKSPSSKPSFDKSAAVAAQEAERTVLINELMKYYGEENGMMLGKNLKHIFMMAGITLPYFLSLELWGTIENVLAARFLVANMLWDSAPRLRECESSYEDKSNEWKKQLHQWYGTVLRSITALTMEQRVKLLENYKTFKCLKWSQATTQTQAVDAYLEDKPLSESEMKEIEASVSKIKDEEERDRELSAKVTQRGRMLFAALSQDVRAQYKQYGLALNLDEGISSMLLLEKRLFPHNPEMKYGQPDLVYLMRLLCLLL